MQRPLTVSFVSLCGLLAGAAAAQPFGPVGPANQAIHRPSPLAGLKYDKPFFLDAAGKPTPYDADVPAGEALLGYPIGERAASHAEIERCMKAWDGKGANGMARARLFEHGKTWGGRTLYHLVVTSPENLARLDEIRAGHARLADQRGVNEADAQRLAETLPAVAWMAYSIHGDETSGSDAALALAHHLIAATDDATAALLQNVVVVIDPLMNPDGRDRFLKMVAEARAANPNVDDQSLVHSGYWPYGRTNHYSFDMNRDWIYGVAPETRGRIAAVRGWNPNLFVDAHEMGSQDTFLSSPARPPINPHFGERNTRWQTRLGEDQARAFDRYGWRQYNGEWNDNWYPGYSDAWASLRGSIGMLFEQARLAEDGVRRLEGVIVTYRESVHHQAVASMAGLETLRANRAEIMREHAAERRRAISGDGLYPGVAYAFPPTGNAGRERSLLRLLSLQGIEASIADAAFKADATDRMGRATAGREFPKGTLIVSLTQPEARMAAALLDFDPMLGKDFLVSERRELLRFGRSRMYDLTAWGVPMVFDTPAYRLAGPALPSMSKAAAPAPLQSPTTPLPPTTLGWALAGESDASVSAAARLMERGVKCRVVEKPATLGDLALARGSVVVLLRDNEAFQGDVAAALGDTVSDTGIEPRAISTGLGKGDENPDLGSEHFPLLVRPRAAIVSRGLVDPNNSGELWHALDQRLGIRTSVIDAAGLQGVDLRRYNVLILPSSWDSSQFQGSMPQIAAWVKAGGTLIAIGSSAGAIASGPAEPPSGASGAPPAGYGAAGPSGGGKESLSSVRTLADTLEHLDDYEIAVLREWEARNASVDEATAAATLTPSEIAYPWENAPKRPEKEELKKRDQWNSLFMPPTGAFVAARADEKHWLTFGIDTSAEAMPIVYTGDTVLMAKGGAQAPIRFGYYVPAPPKPDPKPDADAGGKSENAEAKPGAKPKEGEKKGEGDKPEKPARTSAGWASLPEGQALHLRMSGLLWPEAAVRLANSAFVTREGVGAGQVILFACSPTFRGATLGTERVLGNSVVFGPALGASAPIEP